MSDPKDRKYVKFMNAANWINSPSRLGLDGAYEFDDGLNDDYEMTDIAAYTDFVEVKDAFIQLKNNCCFREVTIPDNVPIIFHEDETYYASKMELGPVHIMNKDGFKWLIEHGANIEAGNYNIVNWALHNNFELFYYLEEFISSADDELWDEIIDELDFSDKGVDIS